MNKNKSKLESYRYEIVVDGDDVNGYTAYLDEPGTSPRSDCPLTGFGESPLQAVRALCETIKQWPISGAQSWLDTPSGVKLAREFVPGFEPRKPRLTY